jgi:hypothetical protein
MPRDFSMVKGRHGLGLLWFAAPKLTLARPKAPHNAGRALNAPAGGQFHGSTPIAMLGLHLSQQIVQRYANDG